LHFPCVRLCMTCTCLIPSEEPIRRARLVIAVSGVISLATGYWRHDILHCVGQPLVITAQVTAELTLFVVRTRDWSVSLAYETR
jgi:hypothetical protein